MPDNGYKEKCSTHKITERWCEEHETWEYYCVRCCKWKDHSSLFLNILGRGFICTSCGSEISEFREERRDEYYQKSNEEIHLDINFGNITHVQICQINNLIISKTLTKDEFYKNYCS